MNHTDIFLLLYFCFTFVHDKMFIVLHNVNILRKLVHPVTGQDWEDLFLFCFAFLLLNVSSVQQDIYLIKKIQSKK